MMSNPHHDTKKPTFSTWERANLERLCDDLWSQNIELREALEQARLDCRDAMKLARANVDDWK